MTRTYGLKRIWQVVVLMLGTADWQGLALAPSVGAVAYRHRFLLGVTSQTSLSGSRLSLVPVPSYLCRTHYVVSCAQSNAIRFAFGSSFTPIETKIQYIIERHSL